MRYANGAGFIGLHDTVAGDRRQHGHQVCALVAAWRSQRHGFATEQHHRTACGDLARLRVPRLGRHRNDQDSPDLPVRIPKENQA